MESSQIERVGAGLFARNRFVANELIELAADRGRAVQAGVEFTHQLSVSTGMVSRREVRHLGALGTAMPAGAR